MIERCGLVGAAELPQADGQGEQRLAQVLFGLTDVLLRLFQFFVSPPAQLPLGIAMIVVPVVSRLHVPVPLLRHLHAGAVPFHRLVADGASLLDLAQLQQADADVVPGDGQIAVTVIPTQPVATPRR
ncbi:hypothetical protein ACIBO5_56080 [Nonomuraea angiospora]|uniref:hypothetical protein n=1 Tax=Nonomuraea angiospora TaxID=46172 RepID=UPI0029B1416A|nr:hypothetical protein [Nonomuraea angiospora]MDX3104500.1 hypothetical protein [Nonomuraea angiospora]